MYATFAAFYGIPKISEIYSVSEASRFSPSSKKYLLAKMYIIVDDIHQI